MKIKLSPLQRQIWEQKYRFKAEDGSPLDETIEASWQRIARALAAAERDPKVWEGRFLGALQDFQFLPAGRIQAGAGTNRQVTLFNCFVMGTIPDDMGGIFQHLREAALTLQQGGGIGYDFSTLRPKGAPVKGVGADASGPLSFMDVWDAMCRTIMSAGSRRGAMMATLSCDHPDIEDFIDAKRQAGRLTNFNLSVLVSDAFMRAVEQDQPWPLQFNGKVYRKLPARGLWDRLMRATYDSAEPGVIFIDRINKTNNLHYCETIAATNPCGEQPLPPYGACLLGSINLSQLVKEPFTDKAQLDLGRLEELTALAVRMLDNAIDVSRFPLSQQKVEAEAKRRIGLGITGLADALIYCGLTYGSAEAIATTEDWMRHLRNAAYRASVDLAAEKGAFPLFDRDKYLAGESIKALPEELRKEIARYGIRNALVTSVAPTGTISLLAGNVSSGLEPVFAFSYRRHILLPDGKKETVEVGDPAWRLWQESHGAEAALPPSFVSAETLSPEAHLSMQAAVQKYIDSSVSKTINLPPTISFEDFSQVYRRAYDLGCKGCTTYRPSAARGAVLEAGAALASLPPAAVSGEAGGAAVVYMTKPLDRPVELPGRTYKLKWPESDHALYITLNDIEQPGTDGAPRRRPFEIFINSKNMEHYAWTVALTRMISAVFRRGGDVAFVVEELKAVFDPRGGAWLEGRYVPSLLAAIGQVIEQHMIEIGFLQKPQGIGIRAERAVVHMEGQVPRQCPKCGTAALIRQEGCDLCTACGHSNCQ